jgi:hypothetical protein
LRGPFDDVWFCSLMRGKRWVACGRFLVHGFSLWIDLGEGLVVECWFDGEEELDSRWG